MASLATTPDQIFYFRKDVIQKITPSVVAGNRGQFSFTFKAKYLFVKASNPICLKNAYRCMILYVKRSLKIMTCTCIPSSVFFLFFVCYVSNARYKDIRTILREISAIV